MSLAPAGALRRAAVPGRLELPVTLAAPSTEVQ